MINPIDQHPLNTIVHPAPAHAPQTAPIPPDVVSLSPQLLNLLLDENLALAFNNAAPEAPSRPPPPSTINQVQTAAQNLATNPDFFLYAITALGGPHDVAALMTARQSGTQTEPPVRAITPVTQPAPTRTA